MPSTTSLGGGSSDGSRSRIERSTRRADLPSTTPLFMPLQNALRANLTPSGVVPEMRTRSVERGASITRSEYSHGLNSVSTHPTSPRKRPSPSRKSSFFSRSIPYVHPFARAKTVPASGRPSRKTCAFAWRIHASCEIGAISNVEPSAQVPGSRTAASAWTSGASEGTVARDAQRLTAAISTMFYFFSTTQ